VFGFVGGWNVLQVLFYVLAGLAACAWLRELGLPRGPALAGGLAFAIAPYRVEQSVGHLLGPISILIPLSLWAFERARRGNRCGLRSPRPRSHRFPLSGQVHLALGAIRSHRLRVLPNARPTPLARRRAGAAAAIGAGLVVRQTVIEQSTQSGGRSLDEIGFYSAQVGDFVSRHVDHARSETVRLPRLGDSARRARRSLPAHRSRRYALATILGLGTFRPDRARTRNAHADHSALWHALPPFRFPRVPERLLPIASLCIAALFAHAVAQSRRTIVAALAIALLLVDLHAQVYGKSAPGDPGVIRRRRGACSSFLSSIPASTTGAFTSGTTPPRNASGPRLLDHGPKQAKQVAVRLQRLNCGDWSGDMAGN